jgi:hypothetical protein
MKQQMKAVPITVAKQRKTTEALQNTHNSKMMNHCAYRLLYN